MAEEISRRVDLDPGLLEKARVWASRHTARAIVEWQEILTQPWPRIRSVLCDPGEEGQRLRQSSPFVGILTPQERWTFYRDPTGA